MTSAYSALSPVLLSLWMLSSVVYNIVVVVDGFAGRTRKATTSSRLYYDIQRDPPNDNVLSILSNTERWISQTLVDAQKGKKENPLSRKEVSYVCETSKDSAMILANIFRKVKEARQLGESHGQEQEEFVDEKEVGEHMRATLRQTQVLVIPTNEELNKGFHAFDRLIETINQARRAARDYITDYSLERLDESLHGEGEDRDWVVSVKCAHLHPMYGEKTPEQELQEMKEEENNGEIDLNLQEYKRQKIIARRSPYPCVVIEVLAMAPPTYTPPPPTGRVSLKLVDEIEDGKENDDNDDDDDEEEEESYDDDAKIDSEFVQQLESLFSKSSLDDTNPKDGEFYESISSHIETVSSVTPLTVAQNWIATNDPLFDEARCAFTISDATHVDEAYEFVFTNLAMQTTRSLEGDGQASGAQKRQYLVMLHFLSNSATSLEKFSMQAENIIRTLPLVGDKVDVSCLHPEHIDENKRCPVPVIVLQWKN